LFFKLSSKCFNCFSNYAHYSLLKQSAKTNWKTIVLEIGVRNEPSLLTLWHWYNIYIYIYIYVPLGMHASCTSSCTCCTRQPRRRSRATSRAISQLAASLLLARLATAWPLQATCEIALERGFGPEPSWTQQEQASANVENLLTDGTAYTTYARRFGICTAGLHCSPTCILASQTPMNEEGKGLVDPW
jgi:hypothetical protein